MASAAATPSWLTCRSMAPNARLREDAVSLPSRSRRNVLAASIASAALLANSSRPASSSSISPNCNRSAAASSPAEHDQRADQAALMHEDGPAHVQNAGRSQDLVVDPGSPYFVARGEFLAIDDPAGHCEMRAPQPEVLVRHVLHPAEQVRVGPGDMFLDHAVGQRQADSVEKLCFGKNASEFGNAVLTRATSANHVSESANLRDEVPLSLPLSAKRRVFQQNRLNAATGVVVRARIQSRASGQRRASVPAS